MAVGTLAAAFWPRQARGEVFRTAHQALDLLLLAGFVGYAARLLLNLIT